MPFLRRTQGDQLMSEGYLIYSEWGPVRSIPRDERLADLFPAVEADERAAWMKTFDDVDREIWRYAETGAVRERSLADFERHMAAIFPFMNDAALGRAWALATYYTVHEGY